MKVIVYYSYTGNTKKIAKELKDRLGCDIYEITPLKPYTSDYNELVEAAKEYVQDNVMPEINKVNLSNYNEIILLTPVWWYTYASPVNTFLHTHNLTNKVVYPIATNAGWLGHTFDDMGNFVTIKNPLSLIFNKDVLKNEDEFYNWINNL